MHIPLVDLGRQYRSIEPEIRGAIDQVLADTAFILGPHAEQFETEFAAFCGTKHCVGLNSGTDGLLLAYAALGIGPGDEVITVANTFFATTEPLGHLGATPVFVDIDPETYLIDVSTIEAAITKRTKAIVPVHLYGQMAPMQPILAIARKHNLAVIEDCAQAHAAEQNGQKAGTYGDIGVYSFYPGKNLGAYGDAGCIITSNAKLAAAIRSLRDHGRLSKYEHATIGYSSRLDGIQAAILSAKLPHLAAWTETRRAHAARYTELLPSTMKKPVEAPGNQHVYHLYTIEVDERDEVLKRLKAAGIGAGVHYPIPLHRQPAYAHLGTKAGTLPVTERVATRILSLPMFAELQSEELEVVTQALVGVALTHA
ncbi:DegT/DnrJ/EryC1/StrS family aminotransferase [Candidatus Berkelbacteria bacterium]|nr:DegT/DnrJ/EryC1/StrS family aminotransferase [Candidatus Berkelbacteria bacterium]